MQHRQKNKNKKTFLDASLCLSLGGGLVLGYAFSLFYFHPNFLTYSYD